MKPEMTKAEALDEIEAKLAAGTLNRRNADFRREQIRQIAAGYHHGMTRSWDQQKRLYAIWAG